jgi:hypothetical protein
MRHRVVIVLTSLAMLLALAPARFAGAGGVSTALTVSKMSIKLNFAKPAQDSITMTGLLVGVLPTTPDYDPTGLAVSIDVGGVVRVFTLDAKGKSKINYDQVVVKLVRKHGVAVGHQVTAKIARASLATDLADEGLTDVTVTNEPRAVQVRVSTSGIPNAAQVQLLYKATQGKSGKASNVK